MTNESAIREDVPSTSANSGDGEGYTPTDAELKTNPRMQMLERMGDRRTEDVQTEADGRNAPEKARPIGIPGGDADPDSPVLEPLRNQPPAAPSQVNQQLAEEPQEQQQAPRPAPRTVRVKVDGVEQDVTEDELIRNYQKSSTADKRLEEASRLLREATERADQLAAQMQTGSPQPANRTTNTAPDQSGANPAPESVVQAKEVLSSLYAGDEDDAATKLANFVEGRAQVLSREQLVKELVPLAVPALQQEISKSDALATLQSDYPDIFSDPDYSQIANAHAGRLLSSGSTEAEAILGAASYVVDKFKLKKAGRSGAASPTGVDVDSARRLERKQAADPVPGLGIASGSTGEPAETDRSSVITEMRKARGQLAA